jgi:hypothetical protein
VPETGRGYPSFWVGDGLQPCDAKRKNVNEMDDWTGAHLELAKCSCPYCGAPIQLVIDPQQVGAQYVEDCEVCCRPMLVTALGESEVICDIEG